MTLRGLPGVLVLLAAGCSARAPARSAPSVEVAGCHEWRSLPRCELPPNGALTVWVADCTPAQARASLGGRDLTPKRARAVQGGAQLVLPGLAEALAPGAVLKVRCAESASFQLALGLHTPSAELDAVAALRRGGDLAGAEEALAALERTAPRLVGLAGQRARNALAAGRTAGAITAFRVAIREDLEHDLRGAELRDRTALAHVLLTAHHPWAAVEAELAALEPLARVWGDAAADLDYTRTAAALVSWAPATLMPRARSLLLRAERLGLDETALDARQMRLSAMSSVGRWDEVASELRALGAALEQPWPSCKEAELWSNLGWYVLLGRNEAPALFPEGPDEALRRAAELYATTCTRPALHANAEVNLAWAALYAGELERAAGHAARAQAVLPALDLEAALHHTHLEAELLLASGEPREAKVAFERLGTLAADAGALAPAWHAWYGRGQAAEALGDVAGAARAYREAEAVVLALARRVPFGEGRDRLLWKRGASAERLVALLARARPREAIAAIRASRLGTFTFARHLAELRAAPPGDARRALTASVAAARAELDLASANAWALPADAAAEARRAVEAQREHARRALDRLLGAGAGGRGPELPPLEVAPNEALLFVHPTPGGLAVIAQDQRELAAEVLATRPGALPILGATARLLARAERVRVFAHPATEAIDWPRVEVEGAPLLQRAPLVFSADLPDRSRVSVGGALLDRAPVASTANLGRAVIERSALLVADPIEALPRAREEGAALERALTRAGFTVELATGRAVDRAALVALLHRPRSLFHYAGHGVRGGLDGLESGFPLPDEQRFTVADVLTLASAPERVVLAACDLGQRGSELGDPGLGLASAFLLAGSREVLAAVRPVADATAARLTRELYTQPDEPLAAALRRATLALADELPPTELAAFRVWVRE